MKMSMDTVQGIPLLKDSARSNEYETDYRNEDYCDNRHSACTHAEGARADGIPVKDLRSGEILAPMVGEMLMTINMKVIFEKDIPNHKNVRNDERDAYEKRKDNHNIRNETYEKQVHSKKFSC